MFERFKIYQKDQDLVLRFPALLLCSLIPIALLFSRAVADVFVCVVGVLFLIHVVRQKRWGDFRNITSITAILFWIWCTFVGIFAFSNKLLAVGQGFVLVRYIIFFFACTMWVLTEKKAIALVVKILTLILILVTLDCFLQFFLGTSLMGNAKSGSGRLTSVLHRATIGSYLSKLIFPVFGFWLLQIKGLKESRGQYIALCGALMVVSAAILLTGERTASALMISALVLLIVGSAFIIKKLRPYMMMSLVLLGGLVGGMIAWFPYVQGRCVNFLDDIGHLEASPYGQLMKASIYSWKEFGILTGVGIRQFRESCLVFLKRGDVTYCDLHSHNIYFELLSESGLIGLSLFVLFVWSLLCTLFKSGYAKYQQQHNKELVVVVSSVAGLLTILCPFAFTMSFVANWSGILNWLGISLCISIAGLVRR